MGPMSADPTIAGESSGVVQGGGAASHPHEELRSTSRQQIEGFRRLPAGLTHLAQLPLVGLSCSSTETLQVQSSPDFIAVHSTCSAAPTLHLIPSIFSRQFSVQKAIYILILDVLSSRSCRDELATWRNRYSSKKRATAASRPATMSGPKPSTPRRKLQRHTARAQSVCIANRAAVA